MRILKHIPLRVPALLPLYAWLHRKTRPDCATGSESTTHQKHPDAHNAIQAERKDETERYEKGLQEVRNEADDLQRTLEQERATSSQRQVELDSTLAENRRLQDRIARLEESVRHAEELQQELQQEKLIAGQYREQHTRAAAEVEQLRTRLTQLEDDARRWAMQGAELESARTCAETERKSAAAQLQKRTAELQKCTAEMQKRTVELQKRTAELRKAQVFFGKAGSEADIEDSEVLHTVELLNAQIFKTAAKMSDNPQFRFGGNVPTASESTKDPSTVDKASKRLERYAWLGPHLLSALRVSDRPHHPFLVRTALQAGMTMYARWLATSWDLGVLDSRGVLEGLYLSVREKEAQPVAGRWRALCRKHIKALLETGEAQTRRLFQTLSIIATDILVVCGVSGTWDSISDTIVSEFESELHQIVNLALEFQWTVGERVISRDLMVFVADSDAVFDPVRMEDERGDPKKSLVSSFPAPRVLCTTHLGLMAETKVGGKEGSEGEVRTIVLAKAQVVLKTVLEPVTQNHKQACIDHDETSSSDVEQDSNVYFVSL